MKEPYTPIITLVIPVTTTAVASTLGEKLAPKEPLETVVPVISTTTSTIGSSTTQVQEIDEAGQIVKAMEEMSLKTNEINSLNKMIDNLEATNNLALINAKTH